MDPIYEKVKANSKFLKIVKEYTNLSGQPTTATTSGANPGTQPTQTQAVDPKLQAAQKTQADAAKRAAQAELTAIQAKTNVDQKRVKELQGVISGKPVVPTK